MTYGVSLGRGGAPSFGAMISGMPIIRFLTVNAFVTGTGFGLYGSSSYVRAYIMACAPLPETTIRALAETNTTGRGWITTAQSSVRSFRHRHINGVGAAVLPPVVTLRPWPLLSVVVTTWDGATYQSYLNGTLVVTQAIATGFTPASPTLDTMNVWAPYPAYWLAHFLGSDQLGAFMNDAQVQAWCTDVQRRVKLNQQLQPWSGCEQWWDVSTIPRTRQTWYDSIGGVFASSSAPCQLAYLPKAAIYF